MSFEPKLEINIEIPFETLPIDGLEKWVKTLSEIQKEYSCNCTLNVVA